ncbi:MAG: hypothetical protein ACLQU3_30765 [Limisphaerales bacterium]
MKSKIINYIRAGYPGLYLVSHEEQRVALEMTRIAQELKYNLVFWSVVDGLVDTQKGTNNSANDPLEALIAIKDLKEKTLILLRDFHLFLADPNPILMRQLKDVLQMAKTKSKTLIILGCRMVLPPELERELTVIEFALPGKEELGAVLGGIMESAGIKNMEAETREKVIDAASGLTTIEAENAFALSVVQSKTIDPVIVAKEKAQAVKKNGLLELIETKEILDSIGGLDVLKEWLLKRRHAFSQRAIEYGLPTPKGLLILGIAGTGKSALVNSSLPRRQRRRRAGSGSRSHFPRSLEAGECPLFFSVRWQALVEDPGLVAGFGRKCGSGTRSGSSLLLHRSGDSFEGHRRGPPLCRFSGHRRLGAEVSQRRHDEHADHREHPASALGHPCFTRRLCHSP